MSDAHDYAGIELVARRCLRRLNSAAAAFAGATGGLLEYEGEMAARASAALEKGIADVERLHKLARRPRHQREPKP